MEAERITFNGTNYVQSFYDDFDGDELNSKNWERCPEWQRQDLGGYWKNDCTTVKDSCLILESKKDGDNLYSGAVRTNGKFEQGYGLYKIRFKTEKTSGCWSAFWLMTEAEKNIGGGAVDGAEIDIFEIIANDLNYPEGKRKYLNSAVHWDGYDADHKMHNSMYNFDDSFYEDWHEITFEWTKDYYKAWLDNAAEPYWDSTKDGAEAYGGINTTKNYVKITSEFGKWGGDVKDELLPHHFYVDWVKIYKPE